MRFGVLGPVRAEHPGGGPIPLAGPRLRALLAMLLLGAGRPLTADRLIDGVWGEQPPAGAGNALQSQVSRLRQNLPIHRDPAGYRLAIAPDEVDAHRFAALAAEGRTALGAGDQVRAARLLRAAAGLWRGEALADVRSAPFAAAQVARLTDLRLDAAEDLGAALLHTDPGAAITELRTVVAAHPLRERPRALLMRALVAAGLSSEAFRVYAESRRVLADELGVDPGPALAEAHAALLRPSIPAPRSADVPRRHAVAGSTGHTGSAGRADSTGHTGSVDGSGSVGGGGGSVGAGSVGGVEADVMSPAMNRPPSPVTSFVGRDDELSRIAAALRTGRLVTLHGPGGAGKTRLAGEAATRHPGPVCFAELAPAGPADLPGVLLAALGLRDSRLHDTPPPAGGPPHPPSARERLVAALSSRDLLLVLDNCEHVIDAAADLVAALLAAAPGLRVLATSREPLGITGETLCPVSGLPLTATPDAPVPRARVPAVTHLETAIPGTALLLSDGGPASPGAAVRLFADRAADVSPGFVLTAGNVEVVGRICRMLDGLPLAVELAAARLHALPVEEVAARLDDRFRLLSRGSRSAQSRHRTLEAVVSWSWDLLTDEERVLARRFTVFAGGASLEALEQVCGNTRLHETPEHEENGDTRGYSARRHGAPDDGVLESLTGLVGKSLVERDGGRYRMSATIRAYCAARLDSSGERERMRRAHVAYFVELAETAGPWLRTAEQLVWLDRLDADRDNLHAALRNSSAAGDAGTALRLVSALSFYWWLRGLRAEATVLAGQVLRDIGPEPPAGHFEAYALCALHAALGGAERPDERWTRYLTALTAPPEQPFALYLSALAVGPPQSDPDEMLLNERLLLPLREDPWSHALGAVGNGYIRLFSGAGPETAAPDFAAALAGFRALGERWGTMIALSATADLAVWRGEPAAGTEILDEALRLATELGSTVDVADLLRGRAEGRIAAGDLSGATADLAQVAALARECGALELVAAALLGHGTIAVRRGDRAEAARCCHEALAACPEGWYGADGTRMSILLTLGRLAEEEGDTTTAADRFREVFTVRSSLQGIPLRSEASAGLARLARNAAPTRSDMG
ncbi:AfsR/SARP family transcriptional regulator [Actinoplanes rectilineatus]|uniref:AfsR/SARP family transcriptional regulator n=1 Tax=Actinoplanes rectilineatus TaxID=113571 RepID=UPI0007C6EC5E|nr:BTAD domain-containing putative transcriptional regulator [Actinoplanes rectilineatus]